MLDSVRRHGGIESIRGCHSLHPDAHPCTPVEGDKEPVRPDCFWIVLKPPLGLKSVRLRKSRGIYEDGAERHAGGSLWEQRKHSLEPVAPWLSVTHTCRNLPITIPH